MNLIAVNVEEKDVNFSLKVKDARQRNVQWKEDQLSLDNMELQEKELLNTDFNFVKNKKLREYGGPANE